MQPPSRATNVAKAFIQCTVLLTDRITDDKMQRALGAISLKPAQGSSGGMVAENAGTPRANGEMPWCLGFGQGPACILQDQAHTIKVPTCRWRCHCDYEEPCMQNEVSPVQEPMTSRGGRVFLLAAASRALILLAILAFDVVFQDLDTSARFQNRPCDRQCAGDPDCGVTGAARSRPACAGKKGGRGEREGAAVPHPGTGQSRHCGADPGAWSAKNSCRQFRLRLCTRGFQNRWLPCDAAGRRGVLGRRVLRQDCKVRV